MLVFNPDFFADETRCDFMVCEKMKRAWAAELEVLSEIIRICKQYHLTYYADWGTLLGAVRHQGYVPWDDDLDIALKRNDYLKLLKILPLELPESYHVSSLYTPGKHNQPISCVTNTKTLNTDPSFIQQFHGCPYIVGVDIAPLDYIPRDPQLAETQRVLYNIAYDAAHRYMKLEQNGELEIYLPKIEELCGVTFDLSKPLRRQLWLLSDQICALYSEEESDLLTWFPRTIRRNKHFSYQKSWYQHTIEMPFENISITVPEGYDKILTTMYGDYHSMKRGISGHNYPFYAYQDEYLKKMAKTVT